MIRTPVLHLHFYILHKSFPTLDTELKTIILKNLLMLLPAHYFQLYYKFEFAITALTYSTSTSFNSAIYSIESPLL